MAFFKKAGRVAKNVAKRAILPEGPKKKEAKKAQAAPPPAPEHTDAEYDELKAKYDAVMTAKWREYYRQSCDGECETCEYYDWCPDDLDDEAFADDEPENEPADDEGEALDEDEEGADDGCEDDDEPDEEDEPELTDEELAAKEAAEAYYADGCDGDCDNCEHYDWCPAEEEGDEDDKILFKDVTQGDVKRVAKEGVGLARETALAARDLKEAIDDITGGLNMKDLLK